ncbi:phosphatase [Nesidiocoris tenuis]|uniref:Serine/threonine-protein phosphatase 2A activator n=1 Tax=Nesidiocoris tenuis TaxID=355587 RepID=A0ABN7A8G0_9HEMI|nr:phosphatase [Nesidiocoris tenuis]
MSQSEGSLGAQTMNEGDPVSSYTIPQRAVFQMDDMARWQNSEAYYEYLGFILTINDSIKGQSCKGKFVISENAQAILTILDRFSVWIDEIPPIQQPQRFGNKAFRNWVERLTQEGPTILVELLPSQFHGGLGESQAYLLEGFGNNTRIDYGTGHEMAFLMFLCCLFKIGVFTQDDQLSVALALFPRYLNLVRKLQTVYKMEPAGSRGVWALDDFQFIPFLWGSSQLIGHTHIRPSSFLKEDIVTGFHDHYMFLACIKYINENKIGPFAEHSNQLWNISALPNWEKVNSGLIKMYKGEVLSKFPVVQHVLFGSILPITPAPTSVNERPYAGLVRDGLSPASREKPGRPCAMRAPPPPAPDRPSIGTGSVASSVSGLSEKFQNVPDVEPGDL